MIRRTSRGTPLIRHDGAWYAFSSDFRRLPDDSLTVIVLANRISGADHLAPPVAAALQRLLLGDSVSAPPAVGVARRAAATACAGEYRLPAGGRIAVRAGERGLHLDPLGADALLAVNGISVDAATRDSIDARSARTRSILEAAWTNDYSVLGQVAAPARAERYASALAAWRAQRLDSLGPLTAVEMLGALPAGGAPGGWNVHARLVFSRGAERVALGWGPAGALLSLVTENPPLPAWSSLFRPTPSGDFVAYDLASGTTVAATCRRLGQAGELEIAAAGHRWTALRR
jgi:hypothetical protein